VHTARVWLANATVRPDDAVAVSGCVAFAAMPDGCVKAIVCASLDTAKLRSTAAAGSYALSPAWVARTVQVPPATAVTTAPDTVHTGMVWLASVTVRPDDAVAVSGWVAFTDMPEGCVNVIVCAVLR